MMMIAQYFLKTQPKSNGETVTLYEHCKAV